MILGDDEKCGRIFDIFIQYRTMYLLLSTFDKNKIISLGVLEIMTLDFSLNFLLSKSNDNRSASSFVNYIFVLNALPHLFI